MSSAGISKLSPLSISAARRIDAACDRWEAAWLAGKPDCLQDYVASFEESLRPALLRQLLLLEWEYLHRSGGPVEFSEYTSRFPEHSDLIQDVQAEHTLAMKSAEIPTESDAEDSTRTAQATQEWEELGYVIVRQLGYGLGTVYLARQTAVDRLVAIKVLRGAEALDSGGLGRFRLETQTLARLQHPHIVPVYDVGQHQGRPFYTMEYCSGGSLSELLRHRPLGHDEAAKLIETLARAVDAAHQAQVIHRDLKPSNVLLQENTPRTRSGPADEHALARFTPKLADFGLAKKLDAVTRTQTGLVVGTPQYMAPEQARGESNAVGVAADIYALGAILYESLTGLPPFRGETLWDTLQQVISSEAKPLRQHSRHIPRDLEAICLKCLSKEPSDRYANAAELADDLRRFREQRPIQIRPAGPMERVWKWAKRHPAVAGLLGVLVFGGILVPMLMAWGFSEQDAARVALHTAADATTRAKLEQRRAQRHAALTMYTQALMVSEHGDAAGALLWLARGLQAAVHAGADDLERSIRMQLGALQRDLRPLRRLIDHESQVFAVAYSPDGKLIATAGEGGTVQMWSTATGQPHGPRLVHEHDVYAVAFSPDSKLLVTGSGEKSPSTDDQSGQAQVWDVATGKQVRSLPHKHRVLAVAFSPDGSNILTGSHDGTAQLWNVQTGVPGFQLEHNAIVRSVTFSKDGKTIATGSDGSDDSDDGKARLWNAATGEPIGKPLICKERVFAVAFSPDGKRLLTGSRTAGQLWNVATGKTVGPPLRHGDWVMAVDFSPDGKTLLTASVDQEVRFWETSTGRPVGRPIRHPHQVRAAVFSSDGRSVLTGCSDHLVREWEISPSQHWSTTGSINAAVISPDGLSIATAGLDGIVQRWNVSTREPIGPRFVHPDAVTAVAFSPNGESILTGCVDFSARVWNLVTGQQVGSPLQHRGPVRDVAFSPDGKKLLTGCAAKTAQQWNAESQTELGPPLDHKSYVNSVAFSPDGKTIVTGGWDHYAWRWDSATGKLLGSSIQHSYAISAVAFDPTGTTFMTGSADKTVRRWDTATGNPVGPLLQHQSPVTTVAFSSDHQTVLTGCADGSVSLWELGTGKRIGLSLELPDEIVSVAFFPDGKSYLTACQDCTFGIWKLFPPMLGDPERTLDWAQIVTGREIDEFGTLRSLHAAAWNKLREKLPLENDQK